MVSSTTEKYGANKVHDVWVSGGARSPDVNDCLIVAVKENFLSRPCMTPQEAGESNRVELLPLDRTTLKRRWPGFSDPMTRVVDAITKGPRRICKEGQIWGSGPEWIRDNRSAIPSGEESLPPGNIAASLKVHGDVVVGEPSSCT